MFRTNTDLYLDKKQTNHYLNFFLNRADSISHFFFSAVTLLCFYVLLMHTKLFMCSSVYIHQKRLQAGGQVCLIAQETYHASNAKNGSLFTVFKVHLKTGFLFLNKKEVYAYQSPADAVHIFFQSKLYTAGTLVHRHTLQLAFSSQALIDISRRQWLTLLAVKHVSPGREESEAADGDSTGL